MSEAGLIGVAQPILRWWRADAVASTAAHGRPTKHISLAADALRVTKRSRNDADFPLRSLLVGVQWGAWSAVVLVIVAAFVSITLSEDVRAALVPWGGPFGTLVTVAIGAVATYQAAARVAHQARNERTERDIQQARLVTVEVFWSGWDDPQHKDDYDVYVRIANHSNDFILDPRLVGFAPLRGGGEIGWEITETPEEHYPPTIVGPKGHEPLLVKFTNHEEVEAGVDGKPVAMIAFTDAAGLRWRRAGSNRPVPVRIDATSTDAPGAAARDLRAGGPDWYRIDS